jgi:hypothetical protein
MACAAASGAANGVDGEAAAAAAAAASAVTAATAAAADAPPAAPGAAACTDAREGDLPRVDMLARELVELAVVSTELVRLRPEAEPFRREALQHR